MSPGREPTPSPRQTKKAARFSPGGLVEALASPRFLAAWHIFFTFGVCMRIETEPEAVTIPFGQPQTNHAIGTELICAGRARRPATRQHAGGSYGRYAQRGSMLCGSGHHRWFPVSCGSAAVSPSLSPRMTATFRRVNPTKPQKRSPACRAQARAACVVHSGRTTCAGEREGNDDSSRCLRACTAFANRE
jgi:hypothetical protein